MYRPCYLQIDLSGPLDFGPGPDLFFFFFSTRCTIIMIFLRSRKSKFMTDYGWNGHVGVFTHIVCVGGFKLCGWREFFSKIAG